MDPEPKSQLVDSSVAGSSSSSSSSSTSSSSFHETTTTTMNSYSVNILDLPTEILEKIFLYITYEQISKVRRVSTRFNDIGSSLLNSAFQRLQAIMLQRFQQIKSQMPRRESARRNHPLARECDIVETVHMRLTLLQMSFGKHIERKHCCFFAGEILDEVYRIFRHIKSTPNLGRAYKVTDELFDLTTMAMEYFKEYIEPELPEITYFAADFLDYSSFSSNSIKSCNWKNATPLGSPSTSVSPGPPDESHDLQPNSVMINLKIKRLRQGMKRNNSRVLLMKRELKSNKNQMADQQKQLIEYGTRFEDNDKTFEEYSRKFSSLLQELNKCKTELQYWRSKSPANQTCCTCNLAVVEDVRNAVDDDIEASEDAVKDSSSLPSSCFLKDSNDVDVVGNSVIDSFEFVPIPVKEEFLQNTNDHLSFRDPCHSRCLDIVQETPQPEERNRGDGNLSLKLIPGKRKANNNNNGRNFLSGDEETCGEVLPSSSSSAKRSKSVVKCLSYK